jgi:uncharacterized protein involved in outer membrane biogenesis
MVSRRSALWLLSLGLPVLVIAIIVGTWGWDLLLPLVQNRASAALGRPVTIAHLHVSPGWTTRITADDVVVGNPINWQGDPLASIPQVTVDVDAWTYLRAGPLIIPSVVIENPVVSAVQGPEGAANYILQLASGGGTDTKIGNVRIDGGHARVQLAKLQADFELEIATHDADNQSTIEVNAHGTYAAQPITGRLIGGALLSLRDATQPWPIDLQLQDGPTHVTLVGTLVDPLALQDANLKLQFAGPDMSLLEKLIGIPIPKTPNYQVTGQLDFADKRIQFRNFQGRVGNSDLEGTIDVDPLKESPEVTANLVSKRVDLPDLGGFIGAEPGRVTTAGATTAQRAEVAKAQVSSKLLPDRPISVPKLHWANIHLKYKGEKIQGSSMPLDNVEAALDIVDGQVTVHPISFAVGSGHIIANIGLTPEGQQTHAKADIDFQRIDVARLMAATHIFQGAGTISGTGSFDSNGNNLAQMLANGNGTIRVAMVGGDLSALLVDLSGLEFGKALLAALGLPTRMQTECFINDLVLQHGVLRIQAMVLDTDSAIVNGAGYVDLRDEQLDLQLRTESKHFTIGSLPAPVNVTGMLKHPSVAPGGELIARGAAAAGLGVVFAPLALLPTIQFGVGDDHRCDALLARAKQLPGGSRLPATAKVPTRR